MILRIFGLHFRELDLAQGLIAHEREGMPAGKRHQNDGGGKNARLKHAPPAPCGNVSRNR